MFRSRIIGDELIADPLISVDVGNIGASQNSNFRLRETAAHRSQRRHRHDGVTHPVRCANENLHAAAPIFAASKRSRTLRKSASGLTPISITEMNTGGSSHFHAARFWASFSVVIKALAPPVVPACLIDKTSSSVYR